jgi:hypothetical protein
VCTRFWWGILRESVHFADPDVDERIILKWMVVRDVQIFWWGTLRKRDHCAGPNVDRRIIL